MKIEEFLSIVDNAPDDILMKSIHNCHAMHVDSIVLDVNKTNGALTRMFLAWPGHQLYHNGSQSEQLCVGVHNHKYDLILSHCYGTVINRCFEITDSTINYSKLYDEYKFVSGIETGKFAAEKIGQARLDCYLEDDLKYSSVTLFAYELHTIEARGPAAWLVEEMPIKDNIPESRLYTNDPNGPISDPRFYLKFNTANDVRKHCHRFVDLINGPY